jgi:hypothetical protein
MTIDINKCDNYLIAFMYYYFKVYLYTMLMKNNNRKEPYRDSI